MKFIKALFVAGVLAFAGSVSAMPIAGSIGFTGDYSYTGGATLGSATGIDVYVAKVTGTVDGSFADAGISDGDVAVYNDFTFAPFSPIAGLWSIAGFTFDLNTLTIKYQDDELLALKGIGTLSGNGYDDTTGFWTFTANASGNNFTFSSGTTAAPAPGIALLLGIGLAAMGVTRRMRRD